jgi:hypothetical protein
MSCPSILLEVFDTQTTRRPKLRAGVSRSIRGPSKVINGRRGPELYAPRLSARRLQCGSTLTS